MVRSNTMKINPKKKERVIEMVSIPLLLMGCGGVGRQLLHHIISCRPLHLRQVSPFFSVNLSNRLHSIIFAKCCFSFFTILMLRGVRLRVVGVCDSQSMMAIPDVLTSEFHDDFLLQLCQAKSSGSSLQELANIDEYQVFSAREIGSRVIDVAAALRKSSGLALVDCSASSETVALLSEVVNLDCCVVLANKKPLTSSQEYYDKLVSQPRRIRHESTVGAGLPVISTINRILSSGDPIFRIIGSLSGTLGYVMSEVEGGRPFSQVVNSAKSLVFTEPGNESTMPNCGGKYGAIMKCMMFFS